MHDTRIKLTQNNLWVKDLDRESWPRSVSSIMKENRPKESGFPNRKNDNSLHGLGNGNVLPCRDYFSNWRANEHTFVIPRNRKGVGRKEPGKEYLEKKRGRRAFEGIAKGSRENPEGRKRN